MVDPAHGRYHTGPCTEVHWHSMREQKPRSRCYDGGNDAHDYPIARVLYGHGYAPVRMYCANLSARFPISVCHSLGWPSVLSIWSAMTGQFCSIAAARASWKPSHLPRRLKQISVSAFWRHGVSIFGHSGSFCANVSALSRSPRKYRSDTSCATVNPAQLLPGAGGGSRCPRPIVQLPVVSRYAVSLSASAASMSAARRGSMRESEITYASR